MLSPLQNDAQKLGVEGYSALGQIRSGLHEAVRRVVDSVDANIVVEEYHRGYLIDGCLFRPALVVVAIK